MLTHWNANWGEGGPSYLHWTINQAYLGIAIFLGSLFVLKLYFNATQDPFPTVVCAD